MTAIHTGWNWPLQSSIELPFEFSQFEFWHTIFIVVLKRARSELTLMRYSFCYVILLLACCIRDVKDCRAFQWSPIAINLNVRRVWQAQKDEERAENLLLCIAPRGVWTRRGNTKENTTKTNFFWYKTLNFIWGDFKHQKWIPG